MHPDVIEAAEVLCSMSEDAEPRARRVLAAQAKPETISDGAVDAAYSELINVLDEWMMEDSSEFSKEIMESIRAALSAALLHIAGGE